MKILAIEQELPTATKEAFQPHMKAEAKKVYELYQRGILREIYFNQDKSIAVLILECADVDEANQYLSQLPFVKENLITFNLIPLIPYSGFSRLFDEKI